MGKYTQAFSFIAAMNFSFKIRGNKKQSVYFVSGLLLLTLLTHLLIRKDIAETRNFQKKGQIKFGIILFAVAVGIGNG